MLKKIKFNVIENIAKVLWSVKYNVDGGRASTPHVRLEYYNDVIMGVVASQITSPTIVFSTVYSGADQRKHQKVRDTGLCEGNSPVTSEFPTQTASKAHVTLCRSFFADVPGHSRPPRSVMIVTKPSDRGLNSRSLSVQDCQYYLSTTAVRHWYYGSVWSALCMFATTITTITDTIDTIALTMLTITPTLLPICYHD